MKMRKIVSLSVTALFFLSFKTAKAASTRLLSSDTGTLTVICGEGLKNSDLAAVFQTQIQEIGIALGVVL